MAGRWSLCQAVNDERIGHRLVHGVNQCAATFPAARAHVGQDDVWLLVGLIDEGIEARGGVDVDLHRPIREEVGKTPFLLILRIEIEQGAGDLIFNVPFGQMRLSVVFPSPPLPPGVKAIFFFRFS